MATDTPEMQAMLGRIERLETSNRRLKRAALAFAVLAVIVFGMAQAKPTPRTVEAEQFILRDRQGRERAALRMAQGDKVSEGVGLILEDETKKETLLLNASPAGPQIIFTSGNQPEIALEAKATGPELSMFSPEAGLHTKAQLGLAVDGSASSINLADASGARREMLTVLKGQPALVMSDDEQKMRLGLWVNANQPTITLSDADGFETKIGSTDLVTPRTGETHKTSAASVALFGKDGKVLWSAP